MSSISTSLALLLAASAGQYSYSGVGDCNVDAGYFVFKLNKGAAPTCAPAPAGASSQWTNGNDGGITYRGAAAVVSPCASSSPGCAPPLEVDYSAFGPITRTYNAGTATWTKPVGLDHIDVYVWGAGGGGGVSGFYGGGGGGSSAFGSVVIANGGGGGGGAIFYSTTLAEGGTVLAGGHGASAWGGVQGGSGGGSGGYAFATIPAASLGATVTIKVGAGGTKATSSVDGVGGLGLYNGGNAVWPGGGGGGGGATGNGGTGDYGGVGGPGVMVGDVTIAGGNGLGWFYHSPGGTAPSGGIGGTGGDGLTTAGGDGTIPGGGGGGVYSTNSNSYAAGNGADGRVVIVEYVSAALAPYPALVVDRSGNVGVGMSTPASQLDVNGTEALDKLCFHGTDGGCMTGPASGGAYTLPVAVASTLGGIKGNGTNTTCPSSGLMTGWSGTTGTMSCVTNAPTASTAASLTYTPAECTTGSAPRGIAANGDAVDCFTPAGTYSLPALAASTLGGVKGCNGTGCWSLPALICRDGYAAQGYDLNGVMQCTPVVNSEIDPSIGWMFQNPHISADPRNGNVYVWNGDAGYWTPSPLASSLDNMYYTPNNLDGGITNSYSVNPQYGFSIFPNSVLVEGNLTVGTNIREWNQTALHIYPNAIDGGGALIVDCPGNNDPGKCVVATAGGGFTGSEFCLSGNDGGCTTTWAGGSGIDPTALTCTGDAGNCVVNTNAPIDFVQAGTTFENSVVINADLGISGGLNFDDGYGYSLTMYGRPGAPAEIIGVAGVDGGTALTIACQSGTNANMGDCIDVVGSLNATSYCWGFGTDAGCQTKPGVITETDPTVPAWAKASATIANGKVESWNGDAGVWTPSTYVVSEVDPKVGTLTNNDWCTSNGTTVNCTSTAPVLSESDPTVNVYAKAAGVPTNGNTITWNGDAGTWAPTAIPAAYSLPALAASVLGGVEGCTGTGCVSSPGLTCATGYHTTGFNSSGVLQCVADYSYTLPVAVASTLGGVKGNGSTTTCASSGLMTGWDGTTGAMSCSTNAPTASTAAALTSTPTECTTGQAARGVAASGNAVDCFTPAGTYSLPALTTGALGGVKGCTGAYCISSPGLYCAIGSVADGFGTDGTLECTNGITNATYANTAGSAGLANALAATPTECTTGQAARGVNTAGNAVDCFTPAGTYSLPAIQSGTLGGVEGCTGAGCVSSPGLACAAGYVASGFNSSGQVQCVNTIATSTSSTDQTAVHIAACDAGYCIVNTNLAFGGGIQTGDLTSSATVEAQYVVANQSVTTPAVLMGYLAGIVTDPSNDAVQIGGPGGVEILGGLMPGISCSTGTVLTSLDGGFLSCASVVISETDPTVPAWAKASNTVANGAFSTWNGDAGVWAPTTNAATSTALASTPTECTTGQAARGIATSGNAVDCFTPAGTYSLPALASGTLGGVEGCTGASCISSPGLTCASGYHVNGFTASTGLMVCTADPTVPALPLVAANGGLGAAQPTCETGKVLTCNGSTCTCTLPTSAACAAGQYLTSPDGGLPTCGTPTGTYSLPALAAGTLGGTEGCTGAGCVTSPGLTCASGYAASGYNSSGVMQCTAIVASETDPNVPWEWKAATGTPTNGKTEVWNGDAGAWTPSTVVAAESDPTVNVYFKAAGIPTNSNAMTWNGDAGAWAPTGVGGYSLPVASSATLGGIMGNGSNTTCSAGFMNGWNVTTGAMTCGNPPVLTASTLGTVSGTGASLSCAAGQYISGFNSLGTMQCTAEKSNVYFRATGVPLNGQVLDWNGDAGTWAPSAFVASESDPTVGPYFKVTPATPTNGQVLSWNGDAGTWAAGGYVVSESDPTVNVYSKAAGVPTNGNTVTWNGDAGAWTPTAIPETYTLPAAATGTLGGVEGCTGATCVSSPGLTCASGYHVNGFTASTGLMVCTADTAAYTLPAIAAGTLGGIKGCTGAACVLSPGLLCSSGYVVYGFDSTGLMQCTASTIPLTTTQVGGVEGCTGVGCVSSPGLTCASGYHVTGFNGAGVMQCVADPTVPSLPLSIANGGTANGTLPVVAGNIYYGDGSKVAGATGTTGQAVIWAAGAPTGKAVEGYVSMASNVVLLPTATALTGLSWSVPSATQTGFHCYLKVNVSGTNNGPSFSVALNQTGSANILVKVRQFATTPTNETIANLTSSNTYTATITSGISVGVTLWEMEGVVLNGNGGAGTVSFYATAGYSGAADAGAGNNLFVFAGSYCDYH